MKVLLTQDVPKLGQAGDIKEVADGYGRNYLIPRGLAEYATPGVIKHAEAQKVVAKQREAKAEQQSRSLADRIQNIHLHIAAHVGTEDRLYGAITNQEIAERLSKELGVDIDRRKVVLEDPIRHTGTFQVPVNLARNVRPSVTVTVEPAGGAAVVAPPTPAPAASTPVVSEESAITETPEA